MTEFSDRYLLSMVWEYTKKHIKLFYAIIVTLLLNVSIALVSPYLLNRAIDRVRYGDLGSDFLMLPAGYILFNVLSWLFRVVEFAVIGKYNARIIRDMRIDTFSRVLDNRVQFFDMQKSGELTSRLVNDINELTDTSTKIARVITDIMKVLLALALFFYFSPVITLAISVSIPVIISVALLMGRWERKESKKWRENFGEVNARFSDIMSKISISKAFNREKENLERFHQLNERTFRASVRRGLAIFLFWPMTDLMRHGILLLAIAVGTWQVSLGLPLSSFVMFIILIGYFYWPLINISTNMKSFQSAFASLERIAKVSRMPENREPQGGELSAADISGRIEFRDVDFSYDGKNLVLEGIDFSIEPGERVALVGQTGAGKTTIASLLVRFYDVTDGQILLDGRNIEDYSVTSLRRAVGLVSQRVLLFKGTVRENLLIADPDAGDERIWEVLEMVQAREFIETLPGGLDYMVEENGKNLSAGQRQMISFARVLLSDPKLIILDEATSAVDLYTEAKIQDAIDMILSTRTSISIAHRLTTIIKSDKIVVLDHGRVIQVGSHGELVGQKGKYAEMYELYLKTQSAKYLDKLVSS